MFGLQNAKSFRSLEVTFLLYTTELLIIQNHKKNLNLVKWLSDRKKCSFSSQTTKIWISKVNEWIHSEILTNGARHSERINKQIRSEKEDFEVRPGIVERTFEIVTPNHLRRPLL